MSPVSKFNVVVFPAPLCPRRQNNSPLEISNDMSSTAITFEGKFFVRCNTLTAVN